MSHELSLSTLDDLDTLADAADVNETPYNVFIGYNLGHRVFTMSVPLRKFYEISDVANDLESGLVAQRALDSSHAKKLALYMLKGLVSAAKIKREALKKPITDSFGEISKVLGEQPYYSLQPIVCNIRNALSNAEDSGIRGMKLIAANNEFAAFRVFLSERHILWVIDGQHRRKAAEMVIDFLETVRSSGRYPGKGAVLFPDLREVSQGEMVVWNEAYEAARGFATLTIEVHLGLDISQERQLFHDLNNLGKKVDRSLALEFDSANPITIFIREKLSQESSLMLRDRDSKDWDDDDGAFAMKDVVGINAIAFLNKGNISGATPKVVEDRGEVVLRLWATIMSLPGVGEGGAKKRTTLAQPVVLKSLAKITYDLAFSNRRPENAGQLLEAFFKGLETFDFGHDNLMWRYYERPPEERDKQFPGLSEYLPDEEGGNRDLGLYQNGLMRFGAKHNDIFPIIADMVRWKLGLPNRHKINKTQDVFL